MQEVPSQIFNPQVILFSLKYFASKRYTFSFTGHFHCQMKCQCPRRAFKCCVQEHRCKTFSQRNVNRIGSGMSQVPSITLSVLLCLGHIVRFLAGKSHLSEIFLVFGKKLCGVRAVAFYAI